MQQYFNAAHAQLDQMRAQLGIGRQLNNGILQQMREQIQRIRNGL